MSEAVIIKCPLCKGWFDRSKFSDEPVEESCKCGNLTIEVKKVGEENKSLFLANYKEAEPRIKIPNIKIPKIK